MASALDRWSAIRCSRGFIVYLASRPHERGDRLNGRGHSSMTSRSRFIAITAILISALLVPLLAQGPTAVPAAARGAQELAKGVVGAGRRARGRGRARERCALENRAAQSRRASAQSPRASGRPWGVCSARYLRSVAAERAAARGCVSARDDCDRTSWSRSRPRQTDPDIAVRTRALELLAALGDRNATAR